jgi:putative ABC transport system permease protein
MRGLWRRLTELVRRDHLDREATEEMASHIEMLTAQKAEGGMDEREARRAARVELGNIQSAREQILEERTGFALEQMWRELGQAARVLRRSPGLTALSTATMGVGIGVSAILFALVNGIVLSPLHYPAPDRLVRIFDSNQAAGVDRTGITTGNLDDWRRGASSFSGIAGYYSMGRTVSVDGNAEAVMTSQVTDDFFAVVGVSPALGRTFTSAEVRSATYSNALAPTGANPVVILSHAMWRDRFGSASDAVGKSLLLDRRPFTIVGVMPPGLELPEPRVRLWIPWSVAGDSPRDQHFVGGLARLNQDVSIAHAEDQLNTVARDLGARYPDTNRGWGVRLSPLDVETVGETATVLWVLLAAVGLVLLVACANVALLSLMRGLDRADETTVRLALGASTRRLLREFLMESVLLAGGGGLLGLALATAGVRLLPSLTTDLPRLDEVSLDNRALLFIAAVTILTALFSGLPHAWRRTRASAIPAAGGLALRTTASAQRHALRDGIVIAQVALAVVLLAGSALLVRSYLHLRTTNPGFDPRGVLVAPVFLDTQAYNTRDKVQAYYRTLFERLAAISRVTAVGGATTVPTSPLGPDFERPVWPEGVAADRAQQTPASVRSVTPGYFPAMTLRIADGRAFDERDQAASPRVIMVSETLARRLWPGQRAVGHQLVVDYSTAGTYPYEIVGVVGDVRFRGPRSEPLAEIYVPHTQAPYLILNVVIRTNGDPRAMIPAVRQALKEVDPQKPAHGLNALEDLMGATYARDRQTMVTLLVFALAAIFLAVLSVYGVLSQRVRERSREIAIRMALGADGSRLVAWVASTGVRLVSAGIVAGFAIAWMLTGTIDRLLVGVAPTDPLTALAVAAILVCVGLVAILIPSWRATRIDPVAVLRRG